MNEPPSRARRLLLVAVLASFACVVTALASFDAVVTYAARRYAAARGVTCDDRFEADVSWNLQSVAFPPFACEVAAGPIARYELTGTTVLTLAFLRARRVTFEHLRVERRSRMVAARSGDMILDALHIPSRLAGLCAAVAHLAELDSPGEMRGAVVEVVHGADTELRMRDVELDAKGPWQGRARVVELPAIRRLGSSALVEVHELRARATPTSAELEGTFRIQATLPVVGSMERNEPAWLEVTQPHAALPRVRFGWGARTGAR
jgi:hypothetical protein